jgi:hypothetical protein|tara:strand:- start:170 stop:679 length:510 start_codon:yes stop_codon:yes gene_type:complete
MGNRVLIGNHPTHGYGLYVSPVGGNVLGSDNNYLLMDSNAPAHGQLLVWKELTTTSAHNGSTVSFSYNSYGVRNYAMAFCSQIGSTSEDADDISCISEAVNTARATASYSLFGGALGGVNSTVDRGNDITFEIILTNNGNTGTCTIARESPASSIHPFLVNVLIFKEAA